MLNRAIACGNAFLDGSVELVKRTHVRKLKNTLLVLAVVAKDAVERLERHVAAIQRIEHADRLHVMEKITTRALVIDIVEKSLTGMAKGRVAQVVAQANRLDQVAVKPQGAADIACDARDKLHVQATTRQVVVAAKTEDLCFAGIASVRRKMKNLFGIAHKRRTHERALVCGSINATDDLVIVATVRVDIARSTICGNALDKFGR